MKQKAVTEHGMHVWTPRGRRDGLAAKRVDQGQTRCGRVRWRSTQVLAEVTRYSLCRDKWIWSQTAVHRNHGRVALRSRVTPVSRSLLWKRWHWLWGLYASEGLSNVVVASQTNMLLTLTRTSEQAACHLANTMRQIDGHVIVRTLNERKGQSLWGRGRSTVEP